MCINFRENWSLGVYTLTRVSFFTNRQTFPQFCLVFIESIVELALQRMRKALSSYCLFCSWFPLYSLNYIWAVFHSILVTFSLEKLLLSFLGRSEILRTQNSLYILKCFFVAALYIFVIKWWKRPAIECVQVRSTWQNCSYVHISNRYIVWWWLTDWMPTSIKVTRHKLPYNELYKSFKINLVLLFNSSVFFLLVYFYHRDVKSKIAV